MLRYTTGNLLEADVDALVNTVNTVGIMGKGIALMFKEKYQENFKAYAQACKKGEVQTGRLFVTETNELTGPKWVINFPTKQNWRNPTKVEWVDSGLEELRSWIITKGIKSIAIPPLGCGNGGLNWENVVRPLTEQHLGSLTNVEILVYEPTKQYQNVAKKSGVKKLTLARALVGELIRRYWAMGFDCTLLEAQKLVYFLNRLIDSHQLKNDLKLKFEAHRYGPYADNLFHLLDKMDGSYLHCDKRIRDASRNEHVWFEIKKTDELKTFLQSSEAKAYNPVIDQVFKLIDTFESPLELEALATIDWLNSSEPIKADSKEIRNRLEAWPGGEGANTRKLRLFDDDLITASSQRIAEFCQ